MTGVPQGEATPRPWHLRTCNGRLPVLRTITSPHGEADRFRAVIGAGDTLTGPVVATLDFGYGQPSDEANARYIVAAASQHEGLVQALRKAQAGFIELHGQGIGCPDCPSQDESDFPKPELCPAVIAGEVALAAARAALAEADKGGGR